MSNVKRPALNSPLSGQKKQDRNPADFILYEFAGYPTLSTFD